MKKFLFLMSAVALSGLFFTSCDKGDDEVNSKLVGVWKNTHYADWYEGMPNAGKLEDFDWEANKFSVGDDEDFTEFKSDGTVWNYRGYTSSNGEEVWYKYQATYSFKGSTLTLREEEEDGDIDVETYTIVNLTDNILMVEQGSEDEGEVYREWFTKVSSLPDAAKNAELDN
jgi:hypothetical protein